MASTFSFGKSRKVPSNPKKEFLGVDFWAIFFCIEVDSDVSRLFFAV